MTEHHHRKKGAHRQRQTGEDSSGRPKNSAHKPDAKNSAVSGRRQHNGGSAKRFDGKTSEQRRNDRAQRTSDGMKRGGGGASIRHKSGHERNRRQLSAREFSSAAPSQRARTADPARLVAFEVLNSVAQNDSYANLVLPGTIRAYRLDRRDAGFATELTYGTLRNQGTYDAILSHCVDRPIEKVGTATLIVLRMGVHQLLSMRVPTHAALNQSVALTRAQIGSGPANFVNAVLRRVSEHTREDWHARLEADAKDDTEKLALATSHPVWVVRAMRQALAAHGHSPAEIRELLDADNQAPVVNLVALPGLGDMQEATDQGAVAGELVEDSALYSAGDLNRLEGVREGTLRAQDVGSQLVTRALAAAPLDGEDTAWLDLCAGPGGKAALLAALGTQRGARLVANESAPHRAALVSQSLRPFAEDEYMVLTGDGRQIAQTLIQNVEQLPEGIEPRQQFDRVMVDVPCSGLGALRRRPEARWRKSPRDIADLLPLQRELLEAACDVTRPGGVIAYVTCSPHAAETQNIVAEMLETGKVHLLDTQSILQSVALPASEGQSVLTEEKAPGYRPHIQLKKSSSVRQEDILDESSTTAQLWPHTHGTDAMFLALFRKN